MCVTRLLLIGACSIVPSSRRKPEGAVAFLGFELYRERDAAGPRISKLETQSKRLSRNVSPFNDWIETARKTMKVDRLWQSARARLRRHLDCFGVRSHLHSV